MDNLLASRTLDLSTYKTAAGAAKATHRFLVQRLKDEMAWHEKEGLTYRGPDPEYVRLRAPDEENDERWAQGGWHVVWEEGPFEWAMYLESGLWTGEGYGVCGDKITGTYKNAGGWTAEPGFSFSLVFRD